MKALCVLASLLGAMSVASGAELAFTYADQGAWATLPGSQCGGQRQSPINLNLAAATFNPLLGAQLTCTWARFDAQIAGTVTNTGRTLELEVTSPHFCVGVPGLAPQLPFQLDRIHLHFGLGTAGGSEHRLNGLGSALEVHMVHFDSRFQTLEQAALQPNGVMVTAILFDAVAEGLANSELAKMAVVTGSQLLQVGGRAQHQLMARSLIAGTGLDLGLASFFTYRGSLTTPTCNEVVTWIVAAKAGGVGPGTLALFQAAQGMEKGLLGPNNRDLQPLNDRQVQVTFPN